MINQCKFLLGIFLIANFGLAQDVELSTLSSNDLSPRIQSPLYQSFDTNEFDLLVRNVNVFDSPKAQQSFDFMQASAATERKFSYFNHYEAINRQMAQYGDFKVEINNSKSSPFIDYHDQPIYSGSFRVKNAVYQRADRLTGTPRPCLSSRRGLIWY